MNGLVDQEVIQALYRASMAGVKIDLNVRGLCCLRPGIPGISDTISQTSIIGRFLEHARIYYFRNGGEGEVVIGSADLMPRNLNKRVEVLLTIPDPLIKKAIIDHILNVHLQDNVKARRLLADRTEERVQPQKGQDPLNSQEWLINIRGVWHERGTKQ
jgi:polyphosphate kinase